MFGRQQTTVHKISLQRLCPIAANKPKIPISIAASIIPIEDTRQEDNIARNNNIQSRLW